MLSFFPRSHHPGGRHTSRVLLQVCLSGTGSELGCSHRPILPFTKSLLICRRIHLWSSLSTSWASPRLPETSSSTFLVALPSEPPCWGRLLIAEKRKSLQSNLYYACQARYPGPPLHLPGGKVSFLIAETPRGLMGACSAILGLFPISLPSSPQPSTPPFPPESMCSSSPTSHSYTDDIQMCVSVPISSCQWDGCPTVCLDMCPHLTRHCLSGAHPTLLPRLPL